MDQNYSTHFPSVRDRVSAAEWETRVNLAACYRLVDKFGMSELIYNHITARIPGSDEQEVVEHTAHLYQPGTRRPYGVLEWHAMLRLLAAEPGGYLPYHH